MADVFVSVHRHPLYREAVSRFFLDSYSRWAIITLLSTNLTKDQKNRRITHFEWFFIFDDLSLCRLNSNSKRARAHTHIPDFFSTNFWKIMFFNIIVIKIIHYEKRVYLILYIIHILKAKIFAQQHILFSHSSYGMVKPN